MKSLFLGMLVGAGVALLYAPATGSRTRSLLKDKANKLANDTTDFVGKKRRHIANKMQGYRAKWQNATEGMVRTYAEQSDMEPLGVGGRM